MCGNVQVHIEKLTVAQLETLATMLPPFIAERRQAHEQVPRATQLLVAAQAALQAYETALNGAGDVDDDPVSKALTQTVAKRQAELRTLQTGSSINAQQINALLQMAVSDTDIPMLDLPLPDSAATHLVDSAVTPPPAPATSVGRLDFEDLFTDNREEEEEEVLAVTSGMAMAANAELVAVDDSTSVAAVTPTALPEASSEEDDPWLAVIGGVSLPFG